MIYINSYGTRVAHQICKFVEMLKKFQKVERVVRVQGEERWENDTEHCYELALTAWYLVDRNDLDLNKDLVIQYALIHDLVEVYAGDTYIYSEDKNEHATKQQREEDAARRLKDEFPEFPDLHATIQNYEKKSDKESKFVYALDKIQPVLNIYVDGGRTWKERNITIQMLVDHKKDKVALSPKIEYYFNELIALLRKEETTLFG